MSQPASSPGDRVARERRFYDLRHEGRYDLLRTWISRAIGEFERYGDLRDYYDPREKTVLDYGCGPGFVALDLVARGATHVTGIDISEGEVEAAVKRAEEAGVAGSTRFLVADAHATGFDDDSFDLIVGASILHHLDLEPALRELRRILRPGGSAVFSEPLWHNPLLRLGRAITPSARTLDEHPITTSDWELCGLIFEGFRHHERELLSIPLMPLNLVLPRPAQRQLARAVHRADDRLLARFPKLGKYARITFLILE
jgi:SAM-dependent methyltransferase